MQIKNLIHFFSFARYPKWRESSVRGDSQDFREGQGVVAAQRWTESGTGPIDDVGRLMEGYTTRWGNLIYASFSFQVKCSNRVDEGQ